MAERVLQSLPARYHVWAGPHWSDGWARGQVSPISHFLCRCSSDWFDGGAIFGTITGL